MEAWSNVDTFSPNREKTNDYRLSFRPTNYTVPPRDGVKSDDVGKSNSSKKKHIIDDLESFSQNTTLHGLNYVTSKESSTARRLAWTVIVTTMMIVFIYIGIINNVLRYLDRPINTIISMNYLLDMDFPAVTICNYNQWKASIVGPDNINMLFLLSWSTLKYPDQQTLDIINATKRDFDLTDFNMTHQIEDMLMSCSWKNAERCGPRDFRRVVTQWGVCYTFNNPENSSQVRKVKQSGSNYGLSMRLKVEQEEYIHGDNTGAGIRILVHEQGQIPLVKSLGFSVSPGFESHVGMRHTKVENLPYPYPSNCRQKALKFGPYTAQTCHYECYVDYVIKNCGCRDYRMPGDVRICDVYETITCVNNATFDFILEEERCSCPTACSTGVYDVRVSSTYWPSSYVTNMYLTPMNVSETEARKNLLDVKIYFEELSFEKVEQIPAYDLLSLLGDIGGYMGLLCGMSLTTIFEFVDFFVCVFNKGWKIR
ncbi:acid-sensing ion channel 4-A-like [Antedon mediterranea]|uniref:acid-sensing ion channel 4-A-like n=1 Tax=Antedon mediterranea TaxID=105859 RepID=UPI003AF6AB3A